jgi:hypothetical protein
MSFWQRLFGGKPKQPTTPTPVLAAPEPVRPLFVLQRVVPLQPEEEIAERVQASETIVQGYIDKVIETADAFWQKQPRDPGRLVTLVAALKPVALVRYWMECEPAGLDPAVVAELCDLLARVPPPLVQNGPVVMCFQASLAGATGPAENWPMLPREWAAACVGRSLRVPDEVLSVVWPD